MKKYLFGIALLFIIQAGIAQTINATGKVSDSQGKPVPFAFIADKGSQYATYSDSLGQFRLQVTPASTLSVTCAGYQDASVNVENKNMFTIVLTAGKSEALDNAPAAQKNSYPEFDAHIQVMDDYGQIMTKKTVGATQGSRYLFADWVHGFVITQKNEMVQDPRNLYNYDKMGGHLLLTKDKKSAIAVNSDILKTFTLFDQAAQPSTFEIVPAIDPKHYAVVVYAGKNFKIYKEVETTFEKENYKSDGIVTTGHNYDEYTDNYSYYLLKANSAPKKFDLKRKSIKNTFTDQPDKVAKFMADQSGSDIDDNYLKLLGDYLDK